MKKLFFVSSLILSLVLLSGCGALEESYQIESDAIRVSDFSYYTSLLNEYHQITGDYPLTELQEDKDLYVIIIDGEFPSWIQEANPSVDYYDEDVFFEALASEFDEEPVRYYDPQTYNEGERPLFYIYSISESHVGFTVHLYHDSLSAVKVSEHYYKLEGYQER